MNEVNIPVYPLLVCLSIWSCQSEPAPEEIDASAQNGHGAKSGADAAKATDAGGSALRSDASRGDGAVGPTGDARSIRDASREVDTEPHHSIGEGEGDASYAQSKSDGGAVPAPSGDSAVPGKASSHDSGRSSDGGSPFANCGAPLTCVATQASGEQYLIDDFEDADLSTEPIDGRYGAWYQYTDKTGTLELDDECNVELTSPGADSDYAARIAGEGFTDWGAGMGFTFDLAAVFCPYDASYYAGVQFDYRSSTAVRFKVQTMLEAGDSFGGYCMEEETICWDAFGLWLDASPEDWTSVLVSWSALEQAGWGASFSKLDTAVLESLQFEVNDAQEAFFVEVDNVSFF